MNALSDERAHTDMNNAFNWRSVNMEGGVRARDKCIDAQTGERGHSFGFTATQLGDTLETKHPYGPPSTGHPSQAES